MKTLFSFLAVWKQNNIESTKYINGVVCAEDTQEAITNVKKTTNADSVSVFEVKPDDNGVIITDA